MTNSDMLFGIFEYVHATKLGKSRRKIFILAEKYDIHFKFVLEQKILLVCLLEVIVLCKEDIFTYLRNKASLKYPAFVFSQLQMTLFCWKCLFEICYTIHKKP